LLKQLQQKLTFILQELLVQMSLELILGPMFAGKSSLVLSKVRKANSLGWKCLLITSAVDTRSGKYIRTHDNDSVPAIAVETLDGIYVKGYDMVVIEEAQFFENLYSFVIDTVEVHKKKVIVAGLDGDSDRKPFGEILDLIPIADTITKCTSYCKQCNDGTSALFSALVKGEKTGQVCVGGSDRYEPMCRKHYLENL